MKKKYEIAFFSEKGIRPNNQDAVFAAEKDERAIMAVADGMGGHQYGEVASEEVIKAVKECWESINKMNKSDFENDILQYSDALLRVNSELYEQYSSKGMITGATVVLLILCRERYHILSLGDSHIYRRDEGKLVAMTDDDVWENLPEIRYSLTDGQKEQDSRYGKLTAAIGPGKEIRLHEYSGQIRANEIFLLCSDGIYKYCPLEQLKKILHSTFWNYSVEKMAKKLKKCALDYRTEDNYSAVICRCK